MKSKHMLLGLLLLAAAVPTAHAATSDCAPLGHLPTYHSWLDGGQAVRYEYNTETFTVTKGDDDVDVPVSGTYCKQSYSHNDGTEELSDLEILMNYEAQLAKLGATITYKGDSHVYAKLVRNGQETWMHINSSGGTTDVIVVDKHPPVAVLTKPTGYDYAPLGHMPNYIADKPETSHFDQLDFDVQDGDDNKTITVQGAKYKVSYEIKSGIQPASYPDTLWNYKAAMQAAGAQILYTGDSRITGRFIKNNAPVWVEVEVSSGGGDIDVSVIEEKPFQASIQPPTANALKAALDKDGHVALYINFDFDKATLRPDAKPVIAQVLALLKTNPALKLSIVGNTDNVGGHDYNVKLSQGRAATVVAELVKDGIAANRLKSSGDGPDKPIGDNNTAEGRAKNRRVELVKF